VDISNWNLKPNVKNSFLFWKRYFILYKLLCLNITQQQQNTSWVDLTGENQTCANLEKCGTGGFVPFGIKGIMEASAKCFYAYIGN
jgi:hypothetical protein